MHQPLPVRLKNLYAAGFHVSDDVLSRVFSMEHDADFETAVDSADQRFSDLFIREIIRCQVNMIVRSVNCLDYPVLERRVPLRGVGIIEINFYEASGFPRRGYRAGGTEGCY